MTIVSHAKVNIFLKIVGTKEHYHLLSSRFMRVENLYDTLSFHPKKEKTPTFDLEGSFSCTTEQNTIYKAYLALQKASNTSKLEHFFQEHTVHVQKHIPEFAGLGGGSSNAAAFLQLCNHILDLKIDKKRLATIGATIGADVPFFVYDYPSANVSGIGEVVEEFEEEALMIETYTPPIACDTKAVYQHYQTHYHDKSTSRESDAWLQRSSKELLQTYDTNTLNDLFAPALDLYPQLNTYHDKNFFSGSGSSFFKVLTDG